MSRMSRLISALVLVCIALTGATAPAFAAQADSLDSATVMSSAGTQGWWSGWHWWRYTARVGVSVANVRYCASTNCGVVYHVYQGTRVHVYFRLGRWSNIGPHRWIATYLLCY